jgi:hypothetical protein
MAEAQTGVAASAFDKKEVSYRRSLCRVMAFVGGYEPNYNRTYSEAELLEIKPTNIAQYMRQLAYHTPHPGPNDRPTYCRESTLVQYKKGISYFMPHRDNAWNVQANYGNPTRSREVNDVLRAASKSNKKGHETSRVQKNVATFIQMHQQDAPWVNESKKLSDQTRGLNSLPDPKACMSYGKSICLVLVIESGQKISQR